MKALQGVEGQVEWVEEPSPTCDVGQIRIRVAAAGLNRADLLQSAGLYPPPPGASQVLGLECSGVVSEVGPGSSWQVGDRVCALLAGGGMAEEVVVDARHALPVPEGLSLVEAAALPEVYSTAWLNLFQLAALQPGEKVLLHAGASGVGSAAIQLCKAFGSPCWVSVGSAERLAYCQALGAQGGVIRSEGLDSLKALGPFDVVLDPVGANYAESNLKLLAAGRPLKVVRIPSPGLVLDEDERPIPASHMNFLIANGAVVVPTYGDDAAARLACEALATVFSDREIIPLPSNAILTGGGSFHCVSQQEPA